jgi:uncharacterized protein
MRVAAPQEDLPWRRSWGTWRAMSGTGAESPPFPLAHATMPLNVFGTELEPCSHAPLTGFYRDGCCDTGPEDVGVHTVCVIATDEFLVFSRDRGNDLSTPRPEYRFPGLEPGDRWCLCASRWKEAWAAGKAPKVVLTATHEATLQFVPLDVLVKFAWREERASR